jgi:hypothetical protein
MRYRLDNLYICSILELFINILLGLLSGSIWSDAVKTGLSTATGPSACQPDPALIATASLHAQANSHLPFLLCMSVLNSSHTSQLSFFLC